ncbi:MAG: anaerobic ribonucleoside-triphosphate reductase activating protein [Archaeoglobus sp.]|nr:MAG: anaerobic ribonucleoside-triphosphate reductase activating protein [Archaeoglobus sp.]
MRIGGILDISTIDFPGKLCSVVFLTGCPFRCPYCHNHQLINSEGNRVSPKDIASELSKNYLIDGVCITGGEPTMQSDLPDLVKEIKNLGLCVKVDTNGYYPENLEFLLDYVDYVAVDFKTSPQKYGDLTGREDAWTKVRRSLEILGFSGVEWEIRTTVVPGIVWKDEVYKIHSAIEDLGLKPSRIVLQQFNNENPLKQSLRSINPPSKQEILELAKMFGNRSGIYVRCSEGEFEV